MSASNSTPLRAVIPVASDASTVFTAREYGLVKAAYDATETMAQIGVGRTLLYELIKRGELTPLKLGHKTLFSAPDIAALLNRRRVASLVRVSRKDD